MNKIKVIGLTGLYCAGKNHVSGLLSQRGLPVIDADKVGHQAIETAKEEIVACFGSIILDKNGEISRKLLGERVFGRPEELSALEDIIHPIVDREIIKWIEDREEKACVINAALLHRSSVFKSLDAVIIVEAPVADRLQRAKKRDKIPWNFILQRFAVQNEFNYQTEKTDIYIVSNPSGYGKQYQVLRNRLENRIDEILSLMGII